MFKYKEELDITILYPADIKSQIKILKFLFDSPHGCSIDYIIENTNLYRKTIYKYIQLLNILSRKILDKNIIALSAKNIYQFFGNKIDFLILRYELTYTTTNIELLKELLISPNVNITNFCEQYFVSKSTLKKNIKIINDFFSTFDIKVKTQSHNIYMVGDEAVIRYCFTSIFWRISSGLRWPFQTLPSKKIDFVLFQIFKDNYKIISLGKQKLFSYFISVSILRYQANPNALISSSCIEYYDKLIDNNSLKKNIEEALSPFSLTNREVSFIVLSTFTFPEYYIVEENINSTTICLKNFYNDIYRDAFLFINFIKKRYPSWDKNTKSALQFISAIISSRIFVDIFKGSYFNLYDLNLIKFTSIEFPSLIPSIERIVSSFNYPLDKKILKTLIFKYSQAFTICFPPQDFEPKIKIMVDTDAPLYIENVMVNRINSILKSKYNIEVYGITIAKELLLSDPDIVIATGIIDEKKIHVPIIYVYPQISDRDFIEIINTCDRIYKNKIIDLKV